MGKNVAKVFLSQKGHQNFCEHDFFLSRDGNLVLVAKRLFALLRELDGLHAYEKIYCQCPPSDGLGVAIADRLRRAAVSSNHGR
jgi:hypothetical protein